MFSAAARGLYTQSSAHSARCEVIVTQLPATSLILNNAMSFAVIAVGDSVFLLDSIAVKKKKKMSVSYECN